MTLSPELHARLAHKLELEEGRKTHMYKDTRGIETIGVGFNLRANPVPEAVVDLLLAHSIGVACADLDAIEPRWTQLDGERQLVLLEMAVNLGRDRLRAFKRLWGAIARFLDGQGAQALVTASLEILDSDAARELPARYQRLAAQMRGTLTA